MNPDRVLYCCCVRLSGISTTSTIGIGIACVHSMAAYILSKFCCACEIGRASTQRSCTTLSSRCLASARRDGSDQPAGLWLLKQPLLQSRTLQLVGYYFSYNGVPADNSTTLLCMCIRTHVAAVVWYLLPSKEYPFVPCGQSVPLQDDCQPGIGNISVCLYKCTYCYTLMDQHLGQERIDKYPHSTLQAIAGRYFGVSGQLLTQGKLCTLAIGESFDIRIRSKPLLIRPES